MAVHDVINVIYSVMGTKYNKHNESRGQISYNCPNCDDGRNKGKLEINYNKLVMKCWNCCEELDGLSGTLYELIKNEGTNRDISNYLEAIKDYSFEESARIANYVPNIYLPKEYIKITPKNIGYSMREPYNYLKGRGITDNQIETYKIGFCETGEYGGRVVVPSYSKDGKLNFFVARSYVGAFNKYKNPEILKNEIIVNEENINWDSTIYLVEGVFDQIGLGFRNTIPLLGKSMTPKVLDEILDKSKGYIVIILDPEAEKDAYRIYKELESYYHIRDKIRIVELPLGMDLSEIREKYGHKGIVKSLKRVRQLTLSDYLKYSLI